MIRPLLLLLLASPLLYAQSDMTGIELEGATALHLSALFSNVEIREATGDAVTVEHAVTIEGEPRPELAKLDIDRRDGTIYVDEEGPTMRDLSKVNKQYGRDSCCNSQVRMIVRVPAGITVTVETVYGSVDITDLTGLREVKSTYGGVTVAYADTGFPAELDLYSNYGAVDLTIPPGQALRVDLTTQYGELLTDVDLTIDPAASERRDFYEHVVGTVEGAARPGVVRCEAPYGKVYLREG
ncbi:hypothetical protein LEM8419_00095 [Neolewinella maritima]|uniref:Adhesin domain-containing protein n=1 Tax=Neolewinella maritima TaxID=1383882 RepID=A0ABM9AWE4_9BACT|nr:DUF4097 domain-containing protein [Neolewinella maritima]CAH0998747.1 hypothetical protein LEM8419_00095 [Neolewinella maritima]